MRVPLSFKTTNKLITMVVNGKFIKKPLPFTPYVLGKGELADAHIFKSKPQEYMDLWRKKPISLQKLYFDTPKQAYSFYENKKDDSNVFAQYYNKQLMIEKEDFFLDFPNSKALKILHYDLEVFTDGSGVFPNAKNHPIICIGTKTNTGEIKVFNNYHPRYKDKYILRDFMNFLKDENPDIISGYNVAGFDMPYICERMTAHDMSLKDWSRDGKEPYFATQETGNKIRHMVYLGGRIVFDIYDFVKSDSSIMGIKNHKMSTLAEWYDIPYIDLDVTNTSSLIGTNDLYKYAFNDVDVTEQLFDIYFPLQVEMAELMKIPLDAVINGYASLIPELVIARSLSKKGFLPMERNMDRYENTNFQAALVDIFKTGLIDECIKVDINSFYPNTMITFNLGPDTTEIVETRDFTGKYKTVMKGDYLWLNIPDETLKRDIVIKVNQKENGFLREELTNFFEMRNKSKESIKNDPENARKHKAKSDSIKLIMNAIYGYCSLPYGTWGDLGTGIAIVGLARWIMEFLLHELKGDIVELDTDGLFLDKHINPVELNKKIANFIHKNANVSYDNITIELEEEFSGPAYFYKQKNYFLKEKTKIKKKGGALKGTKTPPAFDKVVDTMAEAILSKEAEENIQVIVKSLRDLKNYKLKDFIMNVTIGKSKYDNPNGMQPKLINRANSILKRHIGRGDSISYVKTIDGYKLSGEVECIDDLDIRYYSRIIEKGLYIFGYGVLRDREKKQKHQTNIIKSQQEFFFG